jgi:hypothetical protein
MKVEQGENGQMRVMLPIAAVLTIATMAFYTGYNYSRIESQDHLQQELHKFAIEEVGGLRSDWERENKHVHDRLDRIEMKLEK